jgi:hypothetical protein
VLLAIERALLAYTDALVSDGGASPNAVFDAMRAELSDEQILEFTYITALYENARHDVRALRLDTTTATNRSSRSSAPESFKASDLGINVVGAQKNDG